MLPCLSTHGVDCRAHVAVHCTFYLIIHVVRLLMLSTVRMSRVVSAGTTRRPRDPRKRRPPRRRPRRGSRRRRRRSWRFRRRFTSAPRSKGATRTPRPPAGGGGDRGVTRGTSTPVHVSLLVFVFGESVRFAVRGFADRARPARAAARAGLAAPRAARLRRPIRYSLTIFSDVATCPHAYAGRDRWSGADRR